MLSFIASSRSTAGLKSFDLISTGPCGFSYVVVVVLSAHGNRRAEGRGHGLPGLREERDAHAFGCCRRRDRRRLARAGPRARHLRSGEGWAGGVQARDRARRIQGAVKDSLKAELATRRDITVDESRCIGFMGKEGIV